jgi:signal transduction histidine kinase
LLNITQKQNERLRSFTYIVSHNIRSHSANFSGLLNLTLSEATSVTDKLEMLPLLKETAERLEETLFNLNDVLTIQEDLNHHKTWKNLFTAFQETFSILKNDIATEGASIQVDIETALEVLVIPAYLDSVLLNLLSNALRYRDPERPLEIKLTAVKTTEGVRVSVADNGLGIDLDRYKEKMFGLYKTFHGNKEAKGVGLFLVKAQMQAMGGTIAVESTVGKGSVFHAFFPSTTSPKLETIQKQ